MNRDQLKKSWKEIEAWKDGKTIQYKNEEEEWIDISDPSWLIDTEYRIKPESRVVTFDYSDAEFLLGKAVKCIDGSMIGTITKVGKTTGVTVGLTSYSYESLFSYYTFLDGSPLGKTV